MVCVNRDDKGFVTLLRIHPKDINASAQYTRELGWHDCKYELMKIKLRAALWMPLC
jgi:hypothetical protein